MLSIYTGWWEDPDVLDTATVGAALFNEVIYKTAAQHPDIEVIDIRRFMTGRDMFENYATAQPLDSSERDAMQVTDMFIEPSAEGSRAIALEIANRFKHERKVEGGALWKATGNEGAKNPPR